jgi:hypothetical protein
MKPHAVSRALGNSAMEKRLSTCFALLHLLSIVAVAQEKPTPTPTVKQQIVDLPAPDSSLKPQGQAGTTKSQQSLPKFELQQFVITGSASIDLPNVEKINSDDQAMAPELTNPLDALRDRSTVDFLSGQKELYIAEAKAVNNGRLQASAGTFLNSKIGLWVSARDVNSHVFGDVQYGSIRAYVPYANSSEGHLGIVGGLTFNGPSEWYNKGMLQGALAYGSKAYRFYGSTTPSVTRTTSMFDLSADYSSPKGSVFDYSGRVGLSVASIGDSSASATETSLDFGIGYGFRLGSVPFDGCLKLSLVSTTGSGEGTLPYVNANLKTGKIWFGDLFVQGAGEFYYAEGMLGQHLGRIYPQVEVGYRLLETTMISVGYRGRVAFNSLSGLLQINPYLSATSTIRQSDVPVDILAIVETGWSESLRTRISARYQSIRDYPLFTEGGRKGFWTTAYFGTTNVSTLEADLFAKFAANSYFTLSLIANSSKNSVTRWKIPYIPDIQFDAGVSLEIVPHLRVLPTLRVMDRRVPDLYATDRMKPYLLLALRGEYSVERWLEVIVDFQNMTNDNYESWNGYRSTPFVASAGIGFHW